MLDKYTYLILLENIYLVMKTKGLKVIEDIKEIVDRE